MFGGGGEPQMSEEEMAQMQILQTLQMKDGMRTYNNITKNCVEYCVEGFRVKVRLPRRRTPPPLLPY